MNRHTKISVKILNLFSQLHYGKLPKSSTKSKTEYIYEKNKYTFDDNYLEFNWTKSTIKQFLYYISVVNTDGVALFVEDKTVAEYTNLSVRTVEDNSRLFQAAGLISVQRLSSKASHIKITRFLENTRDVYKDENGLPTKSVTEDTSESVSVLTGYTSLYIDDVKKLLSLDSINELRVALRMFAWYEKVIHLQEKDKWYISYAQLSMAVPEYLKYPSALASIINKLSRIFPISCVSGYEEIKEEFLSYGIRSEKMVDIFSYRVVGIIERFRDSKTRYVQEFNESYHNLIRFKTTLKLQEIDVQHIEDYRIETMVSKFGPEKFAMALNKIEEYLYSYDKEYDYDGVRIITQQLKSDFENYMYSILKRINLDILQHDEVA